MFFAAAQADGGQCRATRWTRARPAPPTGREKVAALQPAVLRNLGNDREAELEEAKLHQLGFVAPLRRGQVRQNDALRAVGGERRSPTHAPQLRPANE